MYSFLPSSLLNARFCFHLIHPHLIIQCKVSFSSHFILCGGGGFIVNINKWYDFEMWALFSFPISEWIWLFFGSFYPPFEDGYKNFRKTDIVSVASPGQDTSYLNHLLQSFLYARTVTKSWCSAGMFFDRYTNFKFINWYLDVTIWI